jgi:hypothetical protein
MHEKPNTKIKSLISAVISLAMFMEAIDPTTIKYVVQVMNINKRTAKKGLDILEACL